MPFDHPLRVAYYRQTVLAFVLGVALGLAALRLIPGLQVAEVDAGCCGMAGAFGYEKEHYDISMAIGEQRLFPAVRSAQEARIAITGVSCRTPDPRRHGPPP